MPWVRFWSQPVCSASSKTEVEESYEYFDSTPSEGVLQEWARELVPDWMERFTYGSEVLHELPEKARLKLIEKYSEQRAYAEGMLELLGHSRVKAAEGSLPIVEQVKEVRSVTDPLADDHVGFFVLIAPDPRSGRKHVYSVIQVSYQTGQATCIGRELPLGDARRIAGGVAAE